MIAEPNPFTLFIDKIAAQLPQHQSLNVAGKVIEVIGTLVKAHVPNVEIGEICEMRAPEAGVIAEAEIVGFVGEAAILSVYGDLMGISTQTEVVPTGRTQEIGVGDQLLGRVIDGMGEALDQDKKGALVVDQFYPIYRDAPDPLTRRLITTPLALGQRALDGMLTCGEGQRLGIFAAAGVGKSTLLSALILGAEADVFVVALIGERGARSARIHRAQSGRTGHAARCHSDRDFGSIGHGARARGLCCNRDRRIFSRPKSQSAAVDGFGHPICAGFARNRPRGRRAANAARLSALRLCDIAALDGARRHER